VGKVANQIRVERAAGMRRRNNLLVVA